MTKAQKGGGAGGGAGGAGGAGGGVPGKVGRTSLDLFISASLAADVSLRIIGFGTLTASVGDTIQSVFGGTGIPEKLVIAFLMQANPADPLRVEVEGMRTACRGGWVLVELQLESVLLPALLRMLGGGDGGKSGSGGGTQAHHMYSKKGVPASAAAALAMYRNASCLVGVRAFAASAGKEGDVMEGVVRGAGGLVEEIHWKREWDTSINLSLNGILLVGDLNMLGLRVLNLNGNRNLKGEGERERERERD